MIEAERRQELPHVRDARTARHAAHDRHDIVVIYHFYLFDSIFEEGR
jgi:hypothetical protein